MKSIGAIVAVAAIAAGLFVFANTRPTALPGSRPLSGSVSGDCPQCGQLLLQIDALQRDLTDVKSRLASQQNQLSGKLQDLSKQPVSLAPRDPETVMAEMHAGRAADAERHHAYVAEVAQAFNNEKTSAGWATQVASRINTAIGSDDALKDVPHSVECRERTCRLQIDDDSSGKVNQSIPFVAMRLVDVLPEISAERVDQGNGRSTMVLYMSSQRLQQAVSK